jgi:hypothetical protein
MNQTDLLDGQAGSFLLYPPAITNLQLSSSLNLADPSTRP